MAGLVFASLTKAFQVGGLTLQESDTPSGNQAITARVATNAGNTGTLTTRTTGSSGTITTTGSAVVATGQTIDIFWTNADGSIGLLANCVCGTVSGTSVPFTGPNSSGAALPAGSTSVVICVPVLQLFNVTGSDVIAVGATAPGGPSAVSFLTLVSGTTTTTTSTSTTLPPGGGPFTVGYLAAFNSGIVWSWAALRDLSTNPLVNLSIVALQASTMQTASQQVQVGVLSN